MKFYSDLHIHSKYSRATSKDLSVENLVAWAKIKGIHVLGTGDFTHPGWMKELQEKCEPAKEEGFLQLKDKHAKEFFPTILQRREHKVRFVLSTEISNIYKKLGKVRKVHNLVYVPDFETANCLQKKLESIGNIASDGRPILGLDTRDLLEIVLELHPQAFLIPAHIWTPWFSLLGSKSGFDTVHECFADLSGYVFAAETGLSSDPAMNWRLSQLDQYMMISNSDAHSPAKIGREATIFDTEFSYQGIYQALKDPGNDGCKGTIEFFPEEGKYHYDGHRGCHICLSPQQTKQNKGLCPVCGRPVVIGVMNRVEELADRPVGEKSKRWRPFYRLISLSEIIAQAIGVSSATTKAVQKVYQKLLSQLGNEIFILQQASYRDIGQCAGAIIAEGIKRMREGRLEIQPGYDGEYGRINLFSDRN